MLVIHLCVSILPVILSYVYRASYTVRTGTCRPTITSHTMIPHHPARGLQAPQILPVAQHHLTPVLQVDTILVVTRTWVRIDLSVYLAALVVRHHPTPVLRVDTLSLDHQVAPALPETKKWTGKEQGILLRVDLLQDNTRTSC